MSEYEVIWAKSAEEDLKEILLYLQARSAQSAKKTLKKILSNAEKLSHFPNAGRIVPELHGYGITLYREIVVERWRLIYRVQGNEVFVLVVIDSRRNVEDILLRRLVRD